MRVQVHDELASAAFGSQAVRQSLQRAALHISVISSGLLPLLLGFLRLFGEPEILIVTLSEEQDCARSKMFSLLMFHAFLNLVFPYIFLFGYSTSSIYVFVTLHIFVIIVVF